MSMEDYRKAYKAGKREYQSRLLRGQKPTLEVLDDVLPNESLPQENLGLVQIPLSQIVGTRYEGRSSAFAANFMPLLEERTEFSVKWANLCKAHETEGIHDAIKAWEYMNKFYVEEGGTTRWKTRSTTSFLIFIRYPVSIISGSRRKEALRHCLRCLEKSRMKYGIMRQS